MRDTFRSPAVARSNGEPGPVVLARWTETVPIAAAVAALALAHLFDYASFLMMVARHGLGAEANPIVVQLALESGLPGLTLAKIVTVTFAALVLVVIATRKPRLALALMAFGVAAGLVGGFSNLASL